MELTKKALEDVKFRTRGKWYSGVEVDAFLEELTVAVDGVERERREAEQARRSLERELDGLRGENSQLWQELNALREAPAPQPAPDPAEQSRRACKELERERDALIQDIKALRRFRETFRKSVEEDAAALSERVKGLGSDNLL